MVEADKRRWETVMDTTEQLNGTYFYGGLPNLNAGELFFWIMVDVTAEHFTGAVAMTGDVVAADVSVIAWKAMNRYNKIASKEDAIW